VGSAAQRLLFTSTVFSLILLMLIGIVLVPLPGHAAETSLEKDLQTGLEQSKRLAEAGQRKLASGASAADEIAALKRLAEDIRVTDLLLQERFLLREEKTKLIGTKAVERQRDMAVGYGKALRSYLEIIDTMPAPADAQASAGTVQQLIDLLDKLVPEKKRAIIGSLPYKHLNLPAVEPTSAPAVTPAYQGGNKTVSPDDTAAAPEAPISKEIAALAQSLNWNPVSIYEYVKNTVETEWYWGCMKGAEETLHQKSGNDCDQAALLTALLRSSGYPARYVRGTIEFFPGIERAKNLTGIDDPVKIAEFFQKAGIPFSPVIKGGTISNFQVEHIWVETQIPYANYRGVVIDEHGKTWLGLDTSIKVNGYTYNNAPDILGAVSLAATRDEFLGLATSATGSSPFALNQTPLEYLRASVNTTLQTLNSSLTYSDYLRTKTLIPEVMSILPASMQFTQVRVTNEYAQIPDELVHTMKFTATDTNIKDLFTITLPTHKLSNQQVTMSYEPETVQDQEIIDSFGGLDNTPAYLVRLRPVLKVNGERIIVATDGLPMGGDYTLSLEVVSPQGAAQVSTSLIAGNLVVIGVTAQKAVVMQLQDPNARKGAERLLYEEAMHYADRWNSAEDELASLLQMPVVRPLPSIAMVGGVIDVTYLMDAPHGFTWKGVYVDADLRRIESVARHQASVNGQYSADRQRLFMQLSSLQGSILENRIFEDDFQVQSISTAKLFQSANAQLVTIDRTTIDAILPTLPFDQNIKDDIANSVNQNQTIRIPAQELAYENWTGIGYVKENPATGESGWMLSGMIAGGMTAWGADTWPAYYAERLQNPSTEPANADPSTARSIQKIASGDMQSGTVGEMLPQPLQVRVADSQNNPVKNVLVTFIVKAGGGQLSGKNESGSTVTGSAIVVPTNNLGIASANLVLGSQTSNNPTFSWEDGDTYPQQVGENIVDAAFAGTVSITKPFTAYGFPGEPHHIKKSFGDNTSGPILSYHLLTLILEDIYNNPISNKAVNFSIMPAQELGSCANPNQDTRQAYLIKADDACVSTVPIWGACASQSPTLQEMSSMNGVAAGVFLGAVPNAQYLVSASSGTLNTTFSIVSNQFGNCDGNSEPSVLMYIAYIYQADTYGNNINAGKINTTVPLLAKFYSLKEGEKEIQETLQCSQPLTCTKIVGNREYSIDTDLSSVAVNFGGQTGAFQGGGLYKIDYVLPGVPQRNNIAIASSGTLYARRSFNSCSGCLIKDNAALTASPSTTMQVYSVDITMESSIPVLVDENGYALVDKIIRYTILPLNYQASTAYVVVYKDGMPIVAIPTELTGQGSGTILRSFQFSMASRYEAEVVLNLGSGAEIKSGKKPIDLYVAKTTRWLVTHDPVFEKNYAVANPDLFKQAVLMSNKATVLVSNAGSNSSIQLLKPGLLGDIVLLSKAPSSVANGSSYFELRTDANGDGKADTDSEGRIYVEGVPVEPGSYKIAVIINGNNMGKLDLIIKPLLTNLAFSPNVLDPTVTFDPYTDKFDIIYGPGGEWYGLQIKYRLNDTVSNMKMEFRDDDAADATNQGDMGGVHALSVSNVLMKKTGLLDLDHIAKWEGFDATITDEKADEIYRDGREAEIPETWNLGDGTIQSARGIAAYHVVREGKYKNLIEVKCSEDLTQTQKMETRFGVQYRIE
jgi:transglutaminase-like putative cysteine protease